jgi:hypothetical protein
VDDADQVLEGGPEPLRHRIRGPHANVERKLTAIAVPDHYDTKEITGPFDHDPSQAPEMAPLLKLLDDAKIPWGVGPKPKI